MIVARPITLMLDDGATDLSEIVHVAGPGERFQEWNNTGVWRQFAVAAGPVHISESWKPEATNELWSVYRCGTDLCLAVHSSAGLGVLHLVRSIDPVETLASTTAANPDLSALRTSFQSSDGSRVQYQIDADRDRWVIRAVNDEPVDRRFDAWPMMEGSGIELGH